MERRNDALSGLAVYLDDPAVYENLENEHLHYPSKNELAKVARDLYLRLFSDNNEEAVTDDNDNDLEPPEKLAKTDALNAILAGKSKSKAKSRSKNPPDILKIIKKEMAVLETTLERPSLLDKINSAILTIPPTSVEAERCFSAAGLFVTKLRTSLKDETIDMLCFLRSHFMSLSLSDNSD